MMDVKNMGIKGILLALLAAGFYAINIPASKILLNYVGPSTMAGFLYLGAGIGVFVMFLLKLRIDVTRKGMGSNSVDESWRIDSQVFLKKEDLIYVVGMVLLDIIAPILLMFGLSMTTSANASLLNSFEIVTTTLIALIIFKENVTIILWIGVGFVTIASGVLSFENISSFSFSWGSLLVLIAAACWGLENNCTRKISHKNIYQIVTIKGVFSGSGSLVVAILIGESFPEIKYIFYISLLGFLSYGLSIFFYISAQKILGAAKTSAYYSVSPFVGALLSLVIIGEVVGIKYFVALVIMVLGTLFVVYDTLYLRHNHIHKHIYTHTHDGYTHEHTYFHSHIHSHRIF